MTRSKTTKLPKIVVPPTAIETIVARIGSAYSLALHTLIFLSFFAAATLGFVQWEIMLLVLTTILSLEAIYLALFIQITVNKHTESLKEVEEDIEEISEDLEELGEDMEDIQEDIEEISEDIDEIQEDVEELNEEEADPVSVRDSSPKNQAEMLEILTRDVARLLRDLEALKKSK